MTRMTSPRAMASITGWLFLITFITSIPAQLLLYTPLLKDPLFILGGGPHPGVSFGALLEIILVVANIGTAVVIYPLLKRQNEALALGFVTARVMESAVIMVGIFSVLSVLTLGQEFAGAGGAESAALVPVGRALVAIHDASFLLGPGFLAGLGNGILLGTLMFRSGLVPRRMAVLGLIGGPSLIVAMIGVLFGVFAAGSVWQTLATVPEFLWELSLGIYLIVKGFKPAPILAGYRSAESPAVTSQPNPALSGAPA